MTDKIQTQFRKDVNVYNCIEDLENLLSVFIDALAISINQADYPAMIITGENQNNDGIKASSAAKLDPGIRLKFTGDFNYDTGEVNRITGAADFYTIPLILSNTSSGMSTSTLVRRDSAGNFETNQLTLNKLILNRPSITVNGQEMFTSDGKIALDSVGATESAVNVTTSIGGVSITDILYSNVGTLTSDVKNAKNVSDTINGFTAGNNLSDNVGIFKYGVNADGSDTYAKRALVANSLAGTDGTTVTLENFARRDIANTFAGTNTFNAASTFLGTVTMNGLTAATANVTTSVTSPIFTFGAASTVKPSTPTFYRGSLEPDGTERCNYNGYFYATKMFNAVYNDFAECFTPVEELKYVEAKNRIVQINDDGKIELGTPKSKRVIGIISDNYGYLLGGSEEEINNGSKIPVGLAGTLWVDAEDDVVFSNIGDFVCSGNKGLAQRIPDNGNDYTSTIVGKIISKDTCNNRYKILLSLK